jgi:hypothetical protein
MPFVSLQRKARSAANNQLRAVRLAEIGRDQRSMQTARNFADIGLA